MRRFTLYILVALLAFGIGLSFVLIFYFQNRNNENINKISEISINYPNKSNSELKLSTDLPKENFSICKDEIRLFIWNELKTYEKFKKWQEKLKDANNCLEKMFEIKIFDLNKDGKNEFLIRGDDMSFCGITGNCDFWIIEKANGEFRTLLSDYSYLDGQDVFSQIEKSKSNKYKDILLEVRVQRNAHAYRLFKFTGKKYKESKCEIHQWNELNPEQKTKVITCKEFEKVNYKLDF